VGRAQGAVHALVVVHDRCVVPGVKRHVVRQFAPLGHRFEAQGVAHALREQVLGLDGLTRPHASVRLHRVR